MNAFQQRIDATSSLPDKQQGDELCRLLDESVGNPSHLTAVGNKIFADDFNNHVRNLARCLSSSSLLAVSPRCLSSLSLLLVSPRCLSCCL
jgi:hypothetical protein